MGRPKVAYLGKSEFDNSSSKAYFNSSVNLHFL